MNPQLLPVYGFNPSLRMATAYIEMPEEWANAANEMDVPMSEYVRRMVRAGRRQLGYDYDPDETPPTQKTLKLGDESSDTDVVERLVLRNLSTETGYQTNDLIELIEDDIKATTDDLADEGKVKYRGKKGGWIKVTGNE